MSESLPEREPLALGPWMLLGSRAVVNQPPFLPSPPAQQGLAVEPLEVTLMGQGSEGDTLTWALRALPDTIVGGQVHEAKGSLLPSGVVEGLPYELSMGVH